MAETSSTSTPKTVFIVGAGASKEAGLPIGSELKKLIAAALDIKVTRGSPQLISGDHDIYEALRRTADHDSTQRDLLRSLQSACWKIRDAMPLAISIDNFMDTHSEGKQIELCGKLAIVRTILEAESKSALFVDPLGDNRQLKFEGVESKWFNSFFQRLTENCKPSELAKRLSSVVLIIFNYDRCIERYLYYALQIFYPSMNAKEVASLLRNIEIYHPYGAVGLLPWSNQSDAIECEYGATPEPAQLLNLSSQIKTFTEGTDESSSAVTAIRSNMKTSHRLVFLGFAFHPLNLDLLRPRGAELMSPPTGRCVFATAHGISDSDTKAIADELAARSVLSARDIKIRNDLTCSQLFQEYSRSMSFT
jgi:hypothetical protein